MIESPHQFKGASYVATATEGSNTGQLLSAVRTAPERTPGEGRVDRGSARREKRDFQNDALQLGAGNTITVYRKPSPDCRSLETQERPTTLPRKINSTKIPKKGYFLLTLSPKGDILFNVRFNKTSFTRGTGFLIEPHNLSGSRFFCLEVAR